MTGQEKFHKVMKEYKDGVLKSHGNIVTDRSQAIAIAFSEARGVDPEFGESYNLDQIKDIFNWMNSNEGVKDFIPRLKKQFASNNEDERQLDKIYDLWHENKSPEEIWLYIHNLETGVKVEHEHKDLYDKLKKRLDDEGIKMPMSEQEFYETIAKAHLKEEDDYYDLLLTYVEKKGRTPEEYWNSLNINERNKLFEDIGVYHQEDLSNEYKDLSEDLRQIIVGKNMETMAKKKGKLKEAAEKSKPSKLKSKDRPSIEEEIESENEKKKELMSKEEKFEKAHTFIENRDMYIALTSKKAYERFVLEEFTEYGQKMPFGKAVRQFNDSHVYYYSDKLKDFLDKHKIHYVIYESKEELLEFIRSKVNI